MFFIFLELAIVIFLPDGPSLLRRFNVVHNVMGLSHAQILQFPEVLMSRDFRLTQRHEFLKSLGRNQYDPTQPNYVSPVVIAAGDDVAFCTNVAKASIIDFNNFIKTL